MITCRRHFFVSEAMMDSLILRWMLSHTAQVVVVWRGDMLSSCCEEICWRKWGQNHVHMLEGVHRFNGSRGWMIPSSTNFLHKEKLKKTNQKISLRKNKIKHLLDLHSSPHEKHVTLSSIKIILQTRKWFQHLKIKNKNKKANWTTEEREPGPPSGQFMPIRRNKT